MYHRYFGMKHRPFTSTPQIGSCFPAAAQEEAFATLQYAITQGRGIAVLTGLPGTGKTLVCHRLTATLEPTFTTAMITNTHMPTVKGLLQAILYDLSLPFHGLDEQELRLTLTDFLLGKYAGGGRTVLIIDEAQNLGVSLLEELRMLSNLEGGSDKLFQIVLAGHPRLLQLLRNPDLETLNQRIGARATLAPLTDEETVGFIQHQLECAGVRGEEVFTYDAMYAVYEAVGGIARLIGKLCDHALLRAYVTDSRRVDRTVVEEAKADLEQPSESRIAGALMPQRKASAEIETATERDEPIVVLTPEREKPDTFVACTEYDGSLETMEISTNALPEDAEPMLEISDPVRYGIPGGYADEEIVVDPYAMMDAARTTSNRARLTQAQAQPRSLSTAEKPDSTANKAGGRPKMTDAERYDLDPMSRTTTRDTVIETNTTDHLFVETGDNAAVHEVGAGLSDRTPDTTTAPILVIESRQQRLGNHMGRVDRPQQTGRQNSGYRQLFTHARKS
jgi:general secretion pathway protein A